MTRVAAIDCGTNSIRLLIADLADGALTDVVRELRIVRLGQDVDRTGRLSTEAIERTRIALAGYAGLIGEHGATRIRMVATSATRDAANRGDFAAMVRAVLGTDAEVIAGEEEAALSFAGAASVLPSVGGDLIVVDIGGGSTELVRGDPTDPGGPLRAHSMAVGCVRLTERHLHDDPPSTAQVAAVVDDVRVALTAARAEVPLDPEVPFVFVAGTATTVAAIALGVDLPGDHAATRLHGAVVDAAAVRAATGRLLAMTRAERAALPGMHPGRADVIAAGAIVLRTLVDEIGIESLTAGEHDILDGIALGLT